MQIISCTHQFKNNLCVSFPVSSELTLNPKSLRGASDLSLKHGAAQQYGRNSQTSNDSSTSKNTVVLLSNKPCVT